MRIDVHAHYYTEDFADKMAAFGTGRTRNRAPGSEVTMPQRNDMLDEAGIDLQILCVGAQQPYLPNEQAAVDAAHYENDFYKETADKEGGRYTVFGCVPLPHVDAAIKEAARCLDELGFPGINLSCSVAGQPLDAFEPFWAEMDRRGAVVFLHPNMHCDAPMMGDWGLEQTAGGCFEDTIAGLRLVFSGVAKKYTNFRLIIPHLGGTLPFLWQRIDHHYTRAHGGESVKPLLGRFYYDTVNNNPASLKCTIDAVGVDHVLFGTDYPYLTHKDCVDYVLNSGLPQDQIRAILDENAQALLKLAEPKSPARA